MTSRRVQQCRRDIDRAYDLRHFWVPDPRIGDDDGNAGREVADGRIPWPRLVLEELEPWSLKTTTMVLSRSRRRQIGEDARDLVIEVPHAAVVQIDDLLEVELRFRFGLGANDFPRVAQLGHDELDPRGRPDRSKE